MTDTLTKLNEIAVFLVFYNAVKRKKNNPDKFIEKF